MKTQIRISFKSENQIPYLMITKEYFEDGRCVHATIIYQEDEHQSDILFEEEICIAKEFKLERKCL